MSMSGSKKCTMNRFDENGFSFKSTVEFNQRLLKSVQGTFAENDELSVCEEDFVQNVSPNVTTKMNIGKSEVFCCICNQPIKGLIVQALNKTWHPNHFTCHHCNNTIKGQKFNVFDNKPFCENDYAQLFLKKCKGCTLPIKDVVVVALKSNWHREHFVCSTCGTQLWQRGFFEKENNPFCKICYEERFCPRCKSCELPIIETAVLALNDKWHQECFRCKNCLEVIASGKFELINEKPICEKCRPLISKSDKTV